MNFTGEIKREMLAKKMNSVEEKRAATSAFMRTNGTLSYSRSGLGFVLVTESEKVGERFISLLEELYGASCMTNAEEDRLSGRDKLTLIYNGEETLDILIDLGIFERESEEENYGLFSGISRRIVKTEAARLAYVTGAFLGSGSCTLPKEGAKTGYHLEFVFAHLQAANDFVKILLSFDLIAKIIKRKGTFIVYFNSFALISDFLAIVGADGALEKLNKKAEEREDNNNSNRVNNCFVGNMDRTATAAAKQCVAFGYLKEKGILSVLDESLKITAQMRLKNPEASLKELSEKLYCGKSCVNHRIRKLMEIYETEKKREEENL